LLLYIYEIWPSPLLLSSFLDEALSVGASIPVDRVKDLKDPASCKGDVLSLTLSPTKNDKQTDEKTE
jgi:hypothetical protein